MDSLRDLAARVEAAGATVSAAGGALAGLDPGPAAFGADVPGRFGELGAALHALWIESIVARSREAAAAGARLADAGEALRTAAVSYAETESLVDRTQRNAGRARPFPGHEEA